MSKTIRWSGAILHLITALGALPAGALFVIDPSGALMGMPASGLAGSPFTTFLIPGLFLFSVNGIGQLIAAFRFLRARHDAGKTGIFFGAILLFWIIIQIAIIGCTSFLQPLFGFTGIAQIILGIIAEKKNRQSM